MTDELLTFLKRGGTLHFSNERGGPTRCGRKAKAATDSWIMVTCPRCQARRTKAEGKVTV